MSEQSRLKKQRKRRTCRVRSRLLSKGSKLRISVFRSLKHICAQIIDDKRQHTLAHVSSITIEKDVKGDKSAVAKKVGLALAKLAKEKSIGDVFFDRGCYRYHGRVKALADGLREGGLKF